MKLLIVDDHPVLREGLAALLRQTGPDTSIVLAESAPSALALLDPAPDLDIVVLDLMMPGMGGMAAITEFGRKRPDLPVIVARRCKVRSAHRTSDAHRRRFRGDLSAGFRQNGAWVLALRHAPGPTQARRSVR